MAGRSPARSTFEDEIGFIPPMSKSALTEFHGGLPKSPMRERFLNDLVPAPNSRTGSRDLSMSPLKKRGSGDVNYVDGGFKAPVRQTDFGKSPIRETKTRDIPATWDDKVDARSPLRESNLTEFNGGFSKSPMRDRFLSDLASVPKSPVMSNRDVRQSPITREDRTPMRERRSGVGLDVVDKSPGRPMVGEYPTFDENEEAGSKKLTVKSSFNVWLPDDENIQQPHDEYSSRTRRDRGGLEFDDISEGRESINDPIHGTNPRKEKAYQGRFGGEDVGGYSKSREAIYPSPQRVASSSRTASNYLPNPIGNHRDPRRSSENLRGSASIQDIAMERDELLRRYKELGNQLGNWGDQRVSSTEYYNGSDEYSEDGVGRFRQRPEQQFVSGRDGRRVSYTGDVYQNSRQMINSPHPRNPRQSYADETDYHHASCSCSLCYTNLVRNPRPNLSMNRDRYNNRGYDPRMAHTGPRTRQSHHGHRHTWRSPLAASPNISLPINGGAPFIICHKCFRLLKLPRKLMVKTKKNQYQVKCGACSSVVSIEQSFTHFYEKQYQDSNDDDKGLKESSIKDHRDSYDFDKLRNSFQSMDSEPNDGSKEHKLRTNVANSSPLFSPTSSRSSKEGRGSDDTSIKKGLVPPPPGSPLRDLHNPATYFGRIQAGEVIIGSGKEIQEIEEDGSVKSLIENMVDATEEDHPNEELPTSFSLDPVDIPPEEDQDGNNKDDESYETGPISSGSTDIYVNGQLISQDLAKQAEKFAGPIQPGEYWYDSKAGFWGPMGHHCMGIIPPFIKEFRYTMPTNCSGGDTTICINGRELHEKDVHILQRRGLPDTRNKRYIIDFYGKVIDEETKELVGKLGKLAPTVEKEKIGFGMKIPQNLND